jgi:hypothetical protein
MTESEIETALEWTFDEQDREWTAKGASGHLFVVLLANDHMWTAYGASGMPGHKRYPSFYSARRACEQADSAR